MIDLCRGQSQRGSIHCIDFSSRGCHGSLERVCVCLCPCAALATENPTPDLLSEKPHGQENPLTAMLLSGVMGVNLHTRGPGMD